MHVPPKINPTLAEPIKALIEESPSFGYRTVAALLGMSKNTVQRIPAQGLAGQKARHRFQTAHSGIAVSSLDA